MRRKTSSPNLQRVRKFTWEAIIHPNRNFPDEFICQIEDSGCLSFSYYPAQVAVDRSELTWANGFEEPTHKPGTEPNS